MGVKSAVRLTIQVIFLAKVHQFKTAVSGPSQPHVRSRSLTLEEQLMSMSDIL